MERVTQPPEDPPDYLHIDYKFYTIDDVKEKLERLLNDRPSVKLIPDTEEEGQVEEKEPTPPPSPKRKARKKLQHNTMSRECVLTDKNQADFVLTELDLINRVYIPVNGQLEHCLYEAVLCNLDVPTAPKAYNALSLRNQVCVFMIENPDYAINILKERLQCERTSLYHFIQKHSNFCEWGEETLLIFICKMWHISISVLDPLYKDKFRTYGIRFGASLSYSVVIIYNTINHFTGTAPKTKAVWKMASVHLREAILKVYKGRHEREEEVQHEKDDIRFLWSEVEDVMLKEEVEACRLEMSRQQQRDEERAVLIRMSEEERELAEEEKRQWKQMKVQEMEKYRKEEEERNREERKKLRLFKEEELKKMRLEEKRRAEEEERERLSRELEEEEEEEEWERERGRKRKIEEMEKNLNMVNIEDPENVMEQLRVDSGVKLKVLRVPVKRLRVQVAKTVGEGDGKGEEGNGDNVEGDGTDSDGDVGQEDVVIDEGDGEVGSDGNGDGDGDGDSGDGDGSDDGDGDDNGDLDADKEELIKKKKELMKRMRMSWKTYKKTLEDQVKAAHDLNDTMREVGNFLNEIGEKDNNYDASQWFPRLFDMTQRPAPAPIVPRQVQDIEDIEERDEVEREEREMRKAIKRKVAEDKKREQYTKWNYKKGHQFFPRDRVAGGALFSRSRRDSPLDKISVKALKQDKAGVYVCTAKGCGQARLSYEAIKSHGMGHTSTVLFCKVCDKEYTHKASLNKCLRDHKEKRTVNCPICNKVCSNMTTLKQHKFTHAKSPSYSCKICNRGFMFPTARFRHKHEGHDSRMMFEKKDEDDIEYQTKEEYEAEKKKKKKKGNSKEQKTGE